MSRHPIGSWPTTWLLCLLLGHADACWMEWPDGYTRPTCPCCGEERPG